MTQTPQTDAYQEFLAKKAFRSHADGITVERHSLHPRLFAFQQDLVLWALRKGRAALFAQTGLGKTLMELAWSDKIAERVLIFAPLAVAKQTVREAAKFGYEAVYARCEEDAPKSGIVTTNYELMHKFNPRKWGAVVFDESSILKDYTSSTRNAAIEFASFIPYRLPATATPAPNDYMELGNHAELLGICSRTEMLSQFFVHDGGDTSKWRLKGHAREEFFKWLATWAAAIRKPSDFGYPDDGYNLPPLNKIEHRIENTSDDCETLFPTEALTLNAQRTSKRQTQSARVQRVAELVAKEPEESWLIWCELNSEGDALEKAIPGAVQVSGSDSLDTKEKAILDFIDGKTKVLISKPSIFGFGLNLQHCARIAFVGISHSFEQTYQAIRRCWRFGQTRAVDCHFIYGDTETAIVRNLSRKEKEAEAMAEAMIAQMQSVQAVRSVQTIKSVYAPSKPITLPSFLTGGKQ